MALYLAPSFMLRVSVGAPAFPFRPARPWRVSQVVLEGGMAPYMQR